jgi:hypothetical protein
VTGLTSLADVDTQLADACEQRREAMAADDLATVVGLERRIDYLLDWRVRLKAWRATA